MTYNLLYESCPWHTRVGLFDEKGRLLSLRVDDCDRKVIEGAVVLGRVRKVVPGLNGAFVDISDTQEGFLRLNSVPEVSMPLAEGHKIMVRVTRGSDTQKGARLDARVALKMPSEDIAVPALLSSPPSALRRALMDAGETPVNCWVVDERTRDDVTPFVLEDQIFQLNQHEDMLLLDALDMQLDDMHTRAYPIPGGEVCVEVTKALTAIDVDAKDLGQGERKVNLKNLNLRAAEEVVRLCRLLDLGGNVVVDFITMNNEKNRKEVWHHLKNEFARKDMAKVEVFPMSRFGLVEINRERGGAMIHELLEWPTYVAGRILLELWRRRGCFGDIYVDAAAPVISVLKHRLTTDRALAQFGRPVVLQAHDDWAPSKFALAGG